MKKGNYTTVCPKCGSTNVRIETNAAYSVTGLINNFKQCDDCGFHGAFFPEVLKSEVRKDPIKKKDVKDNQLVQTSFRKGYRSFLKYFIIPIFLLSLIVLASMYLF